MHPGAAWVVRFPPFEAVAHDMPGEGALGASGTNSRPQTFIQWGAGDNNRGAGSTRRSSRRGLSHTDTSPSSAAPAIQLPEGEKAGYYRGCRVPRTTSARYRSRWAGSGSWAGPSPRPTSGSPSRGRRKPEEVRHSKSAAPAPRRVWPPLTCPMRGANLLISAGLRRSPSPTG